MSRLTDWLPVASDFRGEFARAAEASPPAQRFARLAALSRYRLGYLETIQLDRALARSRPDEAPGLVPVRLAILSSATADHLLPAIRIAGLRRGLWIDVQAGPYGQYRQPLLDPGSAVHRFRPQVVLFALAARQIMEAMPVDAAAADVDAKVEATVGELRQLWRTAKETTRAAVIQQTFLNVEDPLFGSYDRLVPAAPAGIVARLNGRLAEAAATDSVAVVDVARASERDGLDVWFDRTRWFQAKMEISPLAASAYGELVARVIAAQRGLSRKCLVLDLDNTLWGGVVGDDGLDGIVLGEGSAEGEAYLALQRYAKQLRERGVILAVCSRNDRTIAEAAVRDHPEMLLRRSDFAAFVADWNDKAANLRLIADQLNIGLDSLVFVDDSAAERERVRRSLPMVAVPELPPNAAEYVPCLAGAGYFEAVTFTPEDRLRADQYAANAARQSLLKASESLDDFLRGLDMTVVAGPIRTVDLERVTQLINKTNQFNPTTRRYSADQVASFASGEQYLTMQFRLRDRLGDNGLVSAMILRPDAREPDVLEIDTWVMSCRVFGRELEFEAMNAVVEAARRRGARSLRAEYIPTAKNAVVRELYASLGFARVDRGASPNGGTRWELRLADYAARRTHIARSTAPA